MAFTTISSAAAALASGTVTAAELVEESLQAIEQHQSWTNAFIRVDADAARSAARQADRARKAGAASGPLHGVPISVKDLIDVAGQPTTAASRVLKDRVAADDAPVVQRLRGAGAILIGKTNLHEFALGTTSEESAWGPVRHPLDAARSAGGSSGGSAVAVATGMGLASIGSDTGGSIRIPAAACGVVGLKPSYGEVPTTGVVPLSTSLDHVGPIARTVQDAAWVWEVLVSRPVEPLSPADAPTLRLSRLNSYFSWLAPEVHAAFERALDDLRAARVAITEDRVVTADAIAATYVNIVLPEAAAWHSRYLDRHGADYTPAVRARLESGRTISAVDYLKARETAASLRQSVDTALADCDALILPTLPILAPPLGMDDIVVDPVRGERLSVRAAMLRHTQLFNLTGHPAISIPLPTSGLPVGLQLVGKRDQTAQLLAVAAGVERIVGAS